MCQVIKAEDVHVEEKCKYEKWLKITFKIKKKKVKVSCMAQKNIQGLQDSFKGKFLN